MKKNYFLKPLLLAVILFAVLFGNAHLSMGQQMTYGNEWINYSQTYYKLKVPATGIYKLDQAYLQAAGISGVDPRNFQLFRRGKEVAIHVSGESDGSFDAGDFIEFYGEKNDGAMDRELYKNPDADHINTYYSLYTDTAAYFLTWSSARGKRMEVLNQSSANLNPTNWHWQENFLFDNGIYSRGRRFGENYMSWMDAGEGFTGGLTAGWTFNLTNMASNYFVEGPTPKLEIAIIGIGDGLNEVDVFVKPPSGAERLVGTIELKDHESKKQTFDLVASDFPSDGKLIVRVTTRKSTHRYRTFYFRTIYPQRNIIASAGFPFINTSLSSSPVYYEFEGNSASVAIGYDISSHENVKRIPGTVNGAKKGFVFPGSHSKGAIWSNNHLIPSSIQRAYFRNWSGNQADYLIISHKSLMVPTGASTNPVLDYAKYRASAMGGSYDTLVVDVDQIYNQFLYGDKSATAIRRFMKMMIATGNPKYLLILGKGLEFDNVNARTKPSTLAMKDLVPTGGTPASDVFFTSDWEKGSYTPKVPTGRIPASTPGEVLSYLEKVKHHESLPPNLEWRKNMVHLIGSSGSEQVTLLSFMRGFERIAKREWLGADVKSIIRSTTGGLSTINLSNEINTGVSLITFFGHSSGTVSDLDIGRVSDVFNGYKNTGRYPMLLMNGCNAGDTFTTSRTFGEDWLLTPEKGAIAFLAHVSYGYPSLLNVFSSNYYKVAYGDSLYLSKPVGDQHQRATKLTEQQISGDNAIIMIMQMVLQADPALRIIGPEKPDYRITNAGVSLSAFDGSQITASTEKLKLKLDIRNLGRVDLDTFYVSVNRTLENGVEMLYDSIRVAPVFYRDTVVIELDALTTESSGLNKFVIQLDHDNAIDELDETNNTATIEYFFSKSGVLAIGPTEYSIVSQEKVRLIGQSTNLLTDPRGYYFELDTIPTFNSPWLKTNVVQADLMPVWEVTLPSNLNGKDSLAYFWRLRYETIASDEDTVWAVSSFRYMPKSPAGWSQKGLAQLQKAEKKSLLPSSDNQQFTFTPTFRFFEVKGVGGGQHFGYPPYGIFLDNFKTIEFDCRTDRPNMMAIILNDKTLDPYLLMPADLASICGTDPKFVYHFTDLRQAANLTKLEQFLNAIPEGYHVAMVGMSNVPYTTMSPSLKAAFQKIGSNLITQLKTGDPFGIIGRKGAAPGTVMEVGPSATDPSPANMQTFRIEKEISSTIGQGSLVSSLIGPAKNWQSLHHQIVKGPTDKYKLDIIGISPENEEVVLQSDVKSSSFNLSNISTTAFPFLRLRLSFEDEEQRTPAIFKDWTVLYEGVPEGLIRPDIVGVDKYKPESIKEQGGNGQINLRFAYHNISDVSFSDSLTVRTVLVPENGIEIDSLFKVKPLLKGDTVFFNFSMPTLSIVGNNRLRVTVNPRILPEQIYSNNTLELPFTVDQITGLPPTLDVVFDGNRILDGDIVSPNPMISMVLKDNTKRLPITDPSSMKVYLKKPGADFAELSVGVDPKVKWFPADGQNEARVEYQPQLEDGTYTLEAQGFDALGQRTGNERYSITFQVVNESTVTNFYPYPNPFSSKTRFVFTLTGSTVPERMKLQIMTVTGKVIREVQKEELGPIKIGNNISEFAWDGTDEFGDRLANGVYLYRVVMDNGPEEMKHRVTKGDKAFTKDYGKIYILR